MSWGGKGFLDAKGNAQLPKPCIVELIRDECVVGAELKDVILPYELCGIMLCDL